MSGAATAGAAAGPRLVMVDALRGYALMGLFLVHMTGYFELYNARPEPSWVQDTTRILFQGKCFSLLALCFGFSFFMLMESARRRGQRFALRFGWRLVVLLAIGWAHALLYRGDILVVLAVAGLFLIPFQRVRSPRMLMGLAAVMIAQPFLIVRIVAGQLGYAWAWADPLFYDHGQALAPSLEGSFAELVEANLAAGKVGKWSYFIETGRITQLFGLFLAGLAIGRARFFDDPVRFRQVRRLALAAGLLAIVPLALAEQAACCHARGPIFFVHALVAGWLDLAGMTVTLMLLIELWLGARGRILRALAPCGRMTLTLYVGQSLVFVPVFYGFGLHLWDRVSQEQALALGIGAFAGQLLFARWWLGRFAQGPIERMWRMAARWPFESGFPARMLGSNAGAP